MARTAKVLASAVVGATLFLAGCSPVLTGAAPPHATDAGMAEDLPNHLAEPPMTLTLPHRIDNVPLLRAEYSDREIRVYSLARWRGKTITVYYVSAKNVIHDGNHYDLRKVLRVQRIGKTSVRKDGTWQMSFRTHNAAIPVHQGWFFLAKSDAGELGLAQLNTFN